MSEFWKMSEFEKYSEKCQEQNLKDVRNLRNVSKLQFFCDFQVKPISRVNPIGIWFATNMSNSYKNGFTEYMGNLIIRQGIPKYGKYNMAHIVNELSSGPVKSVVIWVFSIHRFYRVQITKSGFKINPEYRFE